MVVLLRTIAFFARGVDKFFSSLSWLRSVFRRRRRAPAAAGGPAFPRFVAAHDTGKRAILHAVLCGWQNRCNPDVVRARFSASPSRGTISQIPGSSRNIVSLLSLLLRFSLRSNVLQSSLLAETRYAYTRLKSEGRPPRRASN